MTSLHYLLLCSKCQVQIVSFLSIYKLEYKKLLGYGHVHLTPQTPVFTYHNILTSSLTDGLCCAFCCSSLSRYILCSHWHTVKAWGRIWGWLKGVTAPPSFAPGNVHILTIHSRPTLESDLVLCDDSPWTLTCFHRVQWILEATNKKKWSNQLKQAG